MKFYFEKLIWNLQVLENIWMYMFTQTDGIYKKKNIALNDKILVSKLGTERCNL